MADPLSLISLAASVISTCYSYGMAVANASQEAQNLAAELSALNALLVSILGLSQSSPERFAAVGLPVILAECEIALGKLLHRLQRLGPFNAEGKARLLINRLRWPLDAKETADLVRVIERQKITLALAVDTFIAQSLTSQQQSLDHIQEKLDSVASQLLIAKSSAETAALRNWLSPFDPIAQHERITKLHCVETCSWINDNKIFRDWLKKDDSSLLWLSGKSGAGKTILTSSVIQDLNKLCHEAGSIIIHYCDASIQHSVSLLDLVGSLTRQACAIEVPGFIQDEFHLAMVDSSQPKPHNLSKLTAMFLEALKLRTEVLIVIDGIDEASGAEELCQWLASLISPEGPLVRVFATSRPNMQIQNVLGQFFVLEMPENSVQNDISLYVGKRLASDARLRKLGENMKSQVKRTLVEKSHGMFRWVQCQLDEISKLRTDSAVKLALQRLPKDLEASYNAILDRVPAFDVEILRRILLWLNWSSIPLSLNMMVEAIAIEPNMNCLDPTARLNDPQDVLEICRSFASYGNADQEVRLVHHSVRDFLCKTLPSDSKFSLRRHASHHELATSCLVFLTMDDFSKVSRSNLDLSEILKQNPLLMYAAKFWPFHVLESGEEKTLQPLILRVMNTRAFNFWLQTVLHFSTTVPYQKHHPQPLYYAASYGLNETVKSLLTQGADIDARAGGYGGTALHAACFRRHPVIVETLLDANPDTSIPDSNGQAAFNLVRWCEYKDVAEAILQHSNRSLVSNDERKSLWMMCSRMKSMGIESSGSLRRRFNPATRGTTHLPPGLKSSRDPRTSPGT